MLFHLDYLMLLLPFKCLKVITVIVFCLNLDDTNKDFNSLINHFTSPTILQIFDFSQTAVLETDASDFAAASILSTRL
ncbi:hypothetical protein HK096_003283 [Nowakowskiella sp. JEL0078]|nr:hypothetical protein HK096_003283 [Nowakowskiella sp. JEL0078]